MLGKNEDFSKQREKMVRQLRRRGIKDERVLKVMGEIPRERFVLEVDLRYAYADGPLAIDSGQTISQPYMVAAMTECLELTEGDKVLEIGTGSGYQTAILAKLAREVYTIERHRGLSAKALDVLGELGIENVFATVGDGTLGLPDYGPYDGIIVTAGAPDYPAPLKEQLANGGRLVAPLGDANFQTLKVLKKCDAVYSERNVCSCKFVKLIGEYGWN